jgi:hypothetical protein
VPILEAGQVFLSAIERLVTADCDVTAITVPVFGVWVEVQ